MDHCCNNLFKIASQAFAYIGNLPKVCNDLLTSLGATNVDNCEHYPVTLAECAVDESIVTIRAVNTTVAEKIAPHLAEISQLLGGKCDEAWPQQTEGDTFYISLALIMGSVLFVGACLVAACRYEKAQRAQAPRNRALSTASSVTVLSVSPEADNEYQALPG